MKLFITFCFLAVAISCSATQLGKDEMSKESSVNNILYELVEDAGPSIQYVVVNKESIISEKNVGLSNIEKDVALSSNNTMLAFSMTKTLTAIAILQLVENNKLILTDKVSDYIKHPYDREITIQQLLNHTSGIPNPIPLKWVHLEKTHNSFDEKSALATVLDNNPDLDSKPGEKYGYSNIGYWLLGSVIEKISAETYSAYVTKNIFEVLGLASNEIGFVIENENNHAKGYLKKWSLMNIFGRFFIDGDVLGEYEGGWLHIHNVYLDGPSFGGAVGSAVAFSKVLQDLLSERSKLLNEKSKQLLYSKQQTNSGESIDMTLGWHIDQLNGITYFFKEGGGAGFHSEMRIYPERGFASVIMTNKTSFNSRDILSELDVNYIEN